MASINKKVERIYTHEGGRAKQINPELQLRRSVMACMLWENSFYESGEEISDRLKTLSREVPRDKVKEIAIEAKYKMGIRHAPLWLAISAGIFDHKFIEKLIRRPDDMTEFLSMYWKDGKKPLPKQLKIAFSNRLNAFDTYQLSKYQQKSKDIKLRDVIRLVHPKPIDEQHSVDFKGVVSGDIQPPDTWESALTAGKDKKGTFTRLIQSNKLGALAFLRNLRNMSKYGVSEDIVRNGLSNMRCNKILPFQFVKSAQYAPNMNDILESKMLESLGQFDKLPGKTVLLVDISGSMISKLSEKSDITRSDIASGLAIMVREICENVHIYGFGDNLYECPNWHGFSLSGKLRARLYMGTRLGACVKKINISEDYDRIIVITDEQTDNDPVPNPKSKKAYMINVAAYKNGIGYYNWVHIDGWSEGVINYILEKEKDEEITYSDVAGRID